VHYSCSKEKDHQSWPLYAIAKNCEKSVWPQNSRVEKKSGGQEMAVIIVQWQKFNNDKIQVNLVPSPSE